MPRHRTSSEIDAEAEDEFQWWNPFDWFGAHDETSIFDQYTENESTGESFYSHRRTGERYDGYGGERTSTDYDDDRDTNRDRRRRRKAVDREQNDERESKDYSIFMKNLEQSQKHLENLYNLQIKERDNQIQRLVEENLAYKTPAIIQTRFQNRQSQTYLPSFIRNRGATGGL